MDIVLSEEGLSVGGEREQSLALGDGGIGPNEMSGGNFAWVGRIRRCHVLKIAIEYDRAVVCDGLGRDLSALRRGSTYRDCDCRSAREKVNGAHGAIVRQKGAANIVHVMKEQ